MLSNDNVICVFFLIVSDLFLDVGMYGRHNDDNDGKELTFLHFFFSMLLAFPSMMSVETNSARIS